MNATSAPATISANATDVIDATLEISNELQLINMDDKLTTKLLAEKINEIITKLNTMQTSTVSATTTRDRGPKSEKDMSEEDARRVMIGDLKSASHKSAAETLGLSYGQVYSARKGFTFKTIYKEMMNGGNEVKAEETKAAE